MKSKAKDIINNEVDSYKKTITIYFTIRSNFYPFEIFATIYKKNIDVYCCKSVQDLISVITSSEMFLHTKVSSSINKRINKLTK